jgi:hypothetical protein
MTHLPLNYLNYQPLEQFEITYLGNFLIDINNSLIYFIFVYFIIISAHSLILYDLRVIPYN